MWPANIVALWSYPACSEQLCFPETSSHSWHREGQRSEWPKGISLLEQGPDQKWCHFYFAAALLPAVSCDVELYTILLGLWAFGAPQYIALVGISSEFWCLDALTCIICTYPRSKPPPPPYFFFFNYKERSGLILRFQNEPAGLELEKRSCYLLDWNKPFVQISNATQPCYSQIPFLILKASLPK